MINRWAVLTLLVLAALLLVFLAMGGTRDHLDQLARNGAIQNDAPVRAAVQVVIQAPPEKVWKVLAGIKDWPKWQKDISDSEIAGPLESGTRFTWTIGGTPIKSRLALVQPNEQLAWTGSAFGARAIHVWKLGRLPDDKTLVKIDESMSGILLAFFYSSKELEQSDRLWLERLKMASEQ